VQIDLSVSDAGWESLDMEALVALACGATLDHLGVDRDLAEISVLATDDTEIATLNADFRDKPTATNVLSWPAEDLAAAMPGKDPESPQPGFDGMIALGDIAVAFGICVAEAATGKIPLSDHVTHLIVHATLHLLGYDHTQDADAELMERLEVEILGKLGISDPYRDKDAVDPH